MANLFCNVLVKFGEGAVEAEQGAIRELAWKKSHATQHLRAVNHALISVTPGSIEMNCGLQSGVGNVYSLNVPVPGKKTNTLFLADSVPNKASDPDIMVNAKPVGFELGVGIVHCWKVSVDGSRWVTLLPADSTNQQQLPDGSNAKLVGRLSGVGIVHSVSAALTSRPYAGLVMAPATIRRGVTISTNRKADTILREDKQSLITNPP
jgi:hypothetical protein